MPGVVPPQVQDPAFALVEPLGRRGEKRGTTLGNKTKAKTKSTQLNSKKQVQKHCPISLQLFTYPRRIQTSPTAKRVTSSL